jgi:hypothetical protein
MTHFGDDLYLGPAAIGKPNSLDTNAEFSDGGLGFGPVGRIYIYDIVPLTLEANNIAASQTPGSAALTLSAGTGITAVVDAYGVTRYTLDVPRAITITSGGNDSGIAFLISGYDVYGEPMTQLLTGGNAGAATTTKAFMSVVSIVPNGAVATTAEAGTADVFGLPVAVVDAGYIIHVGWANSLTTNAGTFVAAVATTPATNLTGDVRGTFAQSGAASNGTNRLVISIALSKLNISLSQTILGVKGVTQV